MILLTFETKFHTIKIMSNIIDKLQKEYESGNFYKIDKKDKLEIYGQYPRNSKLYEILLFISVLGAFLFLGWIAYLGFIIIIDNINDIGQILGGCLILLISFIPIILACIFYSRRMIRIFNRLKKIRENLESAIGTYGYVINHNETIHSIKRSSGNSDKTTFKIAATYIYINEKGEVIQDNYYGLDSPFQVKIKSLERGQRIAIAFNNNVSYILKSYQFYDKKTAVH